MKRGLKRVALALLAIVVVLYLALLIGFKAWKSSYFGRLEANSEIVSTSEGPIELAQLGQGPAVLVLHGTPGGYDQGLLIADVLAPRGFRVLAVSRPGYLRTPRATGITMEQQVDAYAELLDDLGIDRVAVVGGSGGAPAAVALAIRHPDRVWALVHLFGLAGGLPPGDDEPPPPPGGVPRVLGALFGPGFMDWAMLNLNELFPARLLLSAEMGMVNEDGRRRLLEDPERLAGFEKMLWTGYSYGREEGRRNDVAQFARLDQSGASGITAPALFVHGDDDNNAPIGPARALAARIPGAQFLTVNGADHWMAVSRPEDVFPPVVEFLRRNSP